MRIFFVIAQFLLAVLPWMSGAQTIQSTGRGSFEYFQQALAGQSDTPIKCGLSYAMAYQQNQKSLPPDQQVSLHAIFQRPDFLPDSYVSSGGHFKIHYTTIGQHAVDATSTNSDGVPDFVYEAARAAEHAYFLLVDSLGFRPHLPDNGVDGPEYDIYIMDLGNVYGWTFSENAVSEDPLRYNTYMQVDNDFLGGYYTHGIDALRVTIAHEYFHAIQFAYVYRASDLYFFEMSSVWFEDLAFNAVNDYLQYLPGFFRQLDRPLHTQNNWHEYGASIWLKFWLAHRDLRSLRRIWEGMQNAPALTAIENEVTNQGLSFVQTMAEFYSWCLYTGPFSLPGQYFPEAGDYPSVSYRFNRDMANDTTIVDSIRSLSARYYQINIDPTKSFSAILNTSATTNLRILGVPEKLSGKLGEIVTRQGPTPFLLKATENEGTVVLVAVNGGIPENVNISPLQLPFEKYDISLSLKNFDLFSDGLLQPYPNPFLVQKDANLSIIYNLNETASVRLSILNEFGMPILDENLGLKPEGLNQFLWNGRTRAGDEIPSGIYIVLLQTSTGIHKAKKVAVIRQ